jgi:glucokinase
VSIDGENGAGAELGHIIIDYNDNARLCSCGGRGHLEAYASATALVERAGEALSAGGKSSLQTLSAEGRELTPLVLAEHAEAGDELSRQLILDTAMYLGVGIVTVMHTIDPTGIVIGGAMTFGGNEAPLGREFLARVRQEVDHRAFKLLAERITIDYARLGGDAGFIGAAGIARRDFLTQQ